VYPAAVARAREIHLPTAQPRSTLACAAFAGIQGVQRASLLDALFEAFFVDGLDLVDDRTLAHAAERARVEVAVVWSAAYDPTVRQALLDSREAAIAQGVIEVPALKVAGEPPVIGLDAVERRLGEL
jgi:2-hydroxychromene-2-carboxylate isomerase